MNTFSKPPNLSFSTMPPPSYIPFHELTLSKSPPPPKPPEESCFFKEKNGSFFIALFSSTRKLAVFPAPPPPPPPKPPDRTLLTTVSSTPPISILFHGFHQPNYPCQKAFPCALKAGFLSVPMQCVPSDSNVTCKAKSQPSTTSTICVLSQQAISVRHVYVPLFNFLCQLHSSILLPAKVVCIYFITMARANSFIAVVGEMPNQSVLPLLSKAIIYSFMERKVGPCDAYKTIKSLVEYPLVTQFAWPMHNHSIGNAHYKRAPLSFPNLRVSTKLEGLSKFGWLTTFKSWDPGENSFITMVSSLQFKQWDPGKFVITSIFL